MWRPWPGAGLWPTGVMVGQGVARGDAQDSYKRAVRGWDTLRDESGPRLEEGDRAKIREFARRSVEEVKREVFGYHRVYNSEQYPACAYLFREGGWEVCTMTVKVLGTLYTRSYTNATSGQRELLKERNI